MTRCKSDKFKRFQKPTLLNFLRLRDKEEHTYWHSQVLRCHETELKWSVYSRQMRMRPGEKVIDRLDAVEDTKGNNGDRGQNFLISVQK